MKATIFQQVVASEASSALDCRFVRSRTWTSQALLFRIGRRLWQRGRDQQVGSTQHTVACSTHSQVLVGCSGMHPPQARTNTLEAPSVVCWAAYHSRFAVQSALLLSCLIRHFLLIHFLTLRFARCQMFMNLAITTLGNSNFLAVLKHG